MPLNATDCSPSQRLEIESSRPVIMMVEDDEDHRRIYGSLLWYNGFNVFLVHDVASARRAMRFLRPDLILLDLELPDGSGLELCEVARSSIGSPVPVIALSVLPAYEVQMRALAAGCLRYMEKLTNRPLSVLHAVEEVLGKAPASGEGATSWMLSYPKDQVITGVDTEEGST
jgi:DNA-binding response OmpR family regulator